MPKIAGMCFETTGKNAPIQLHQSGPSTFVLECDGETIGFSGEDLAALRDLLEYVRKRQTMVLNLLSDG